MTESATLLMTQKSRELTAKGFNVINLSIGEPDFNTPEAVKEAGKKAIDDNITHYPPVPGFPELRKAIAEKFKRDNGLDYDFTQVVVSNGAKQSIANILMCILNAGDEVIVPAPFWVSYPEMIKMTEGEPVFIYTGIDQDFKVTPAIDVLLAAAAVHRGERARADDAVDGEALFLLERLDRRDERVVVDIGMGGIDGGGIDGGGIGHGLLGVGVSGASSAAFCVSAISVSGADSSTPSRSRSVGTRLSLMPGFSSLPSGTTIRSFSGPASRSSASLAFSAAYCGSCGS